MQKILAIAALAAAVTAYPNGQSSKSTTTTTWKTTTTTSKTTTTAAATTSACASASRDANFDDLTGLPAVELNPIPVPYMGLDFQGFDFITVVETGVAPGVIPHSGTNYAFSNALTTTTGGSAEWTTNYAGSTVKSFSPSSFYYGCVLNLGQGAAAVPTACNIAVTGFAVGDDTAEAVQVVAQEFSYNPTTSTGAQQMAFGSFVSGFKNLQYVLLQYTPIGGAAATGSDLALLVDDVIYTTCS